MLIRTPLVASGFLDRRLGESGSIRHSCMMPLATRPFLAVPGTRPETLRFPTGADRHGSIEDCGNAPDALE